jgi:hypothetical protein
MGKKEPDRLFCIVGADFVAKGMQPGTGIDNYDLSGVRPDLDTGCIAAISLGSRTWCRQRAAAAADFDLH